MKIDNSKYIFKGIVLLICGVLFAFFPGVFSWIFYIIGGAIVIGSLATAIGGLGSGDGGLLPAGIGGALLGAFVMYLPKIISSQISIIAGIILSIIAIIQIVKALSKELTKKIKILQLVFGCMLLVGGIFLIFNPFHGGKIIRFIIGLVMIGYAAFNFYVTYVINERNGGVISSDNIIDTHGYEVNDDHKKIQ